MKPIILKEFEYNIEDLRRLFKRYHIKRKFDLYGGQINELFEISFPSKKYQTPTNKNQFFMEKLNPDSDIRGNWIYFPWSECIVHTLNEQDYFQLRTNRNQVLITAHEQKKIYNGTVGILGLSIGSHIALNLCQQGISKSMKIADYDTIDTTNLNRIRGSLIDLNKSKTVSVQEKIFELNPYSNVITYSKLTKNNLSEFLMEKPIPKVLVEVIDDFEMKIYLRYLARKNRIPVIMLSNVADNIIIDVERYDIFPNLSLFNGLLGDLPERIIKDPNIDPNILAVAMVGKDLVPERALSSVEKIGKTLVGRPQLISTISISSGIATYMIREILLGNKKIQGRRVICLDDIFCKE